MRHTCRKSLDDGKVAVITGAASAVGRAIARAFEAAGANVALIARWPDGLDIAGPEIRVRGGTLASGLVLGRAVHRAVAS